MLTKVLFVDHDSGNSGSTISLKYIIKAFRDNGYEVILLTRKNKNSARDFVNIGAKIVEMKSDLTLHLHFTNRYSIFSLKGIYFFCVTICRFLRGLLESYKLLLQIQPDLLYINEYVLMQFAISAKILGIPSVVHIRSPFLRGTFGFRRKALAKFLLYFNERIFAISYLELKQITDLCKKGDEKLYIVREFLDQSNYHVNINKENFKKSLQLAEGKKIILSLGGINYVKGTYQLLEAIGSLRLNLFEFYLIIAGNSNPGKMNKIYLQKCNNYIIEHNLSENVVLLPFVKDNSKLIFISDVVISSSIVSHFSRPVIEAWALKKPVIVADTPHIREYVKHEINGLLYDPFSPTDLANKILMIFKSKTLRSKIIEKGFLTAKTFYDVDDNTKIILMECQKVIKKIN